MVRAAIVFMFGMTRLIGVFAQTPRNPALEGLDPVLLTEGQETPGKESIRMESGPYLYQFSTEETRSRFRQDPKRYGIQLDGACARMGPPVRGSADAYWVYNHRIYVFGSSECYRRFTANPKKYLEEEQPQPAWAPSAATRAQGETLFDKAIAAMGGSDKWAGIQSYAETRHSSGPAGDLTIRVAAKLPASFITETITGSNTFGSLVTPELVLSLFRDTGTRLPDSFGRAILAVSQRDLLPLLLDRRQPGFGVYDRGRAGGADRLQVNDQGRISTLWCDPQSGRIVDVAWLGPSPAGYVIHHFHYSDYRAVNGFELPFRAEAFDEGSGEPVPAARSWIVESYELNPADIETRLRPRVKIAEP